MYLVVCNDMIEPEGAIRNAAFLLGRDGKEIGRYYKVNLPLAEQSRTPGDGFPVFDTPDLGSVGMLICYDLVFPETTRCLALQGADVVFVSTMGGAAMGDEAFARAWAFGSAMALEAVVAETLQPGEGSCSAEKGDDRLLRNPARRAS